MEKALSVIRWIAHKIFLFFLVNVVLFFVPLMAVSVNITDSNQVKSWLSDSNTYARVLDESLALVERDDSTESLFDQTKDSIIDSAELLEAVKSAIPPEALQEQAEIFIDGMYGWLQGDTVEPEFVVTLAGQSDEVSRALSENLKRQLSEIPVCAQDQAQFEFDIFEASCLPPGVSLDQQINNGVEEFTSDDGVIGEQLTGEDLDLDNDTLVNGPAVFSALELIPFLVITLTIGLSVLAFATSRHWRKGFKEIGGTLFGSSLLMTLLFFLASRMSNVPGGYITDSESSDSQNEAIQAVAKPLLQTITSDVATTGFFFSLVVLFLGAVLWVLGWKIFDAKEDEPSIDSNESVNKDSQKNDSENDVNNDDTPELLKDDGHGTGIVDKFHMSKQKQEAKKEAEKKKITGGKKPKPPLVQ